MARQHRAEHQDRGPHRLDEVVRRFEFGDRRRVNLDGHILVNRDAYTHAPQQFDAGGHVVQVRDIVQPDRLVSQQGSREYRQGGVFCAGNANLACQPFAAIDQQGIQNQPLCAACSATHSSGLWARMDSA
ncbi:hypothetical protein MnTg04_00223 [bacterium MnTg04]|nr:hypothetical protein MnTg04_00223 [bacterium MnTg04]